MPLSEKQLANLEAAGFKAFWDVDEFLDHLESKMSKLPPHVERVRKEKDELDAKIRKLERFLDKDVFPDSVKPQELEIMKRQIWAMDALSEILAERLALWKGKANE